MKIIEKTKNFVKEHKAEIALCGIGVATTIIGAKTFYKKGCRKGEDYTLSSLGVDPNKKIFWCSTKIAASEILDKARFIDDSSKKFLEKNIDKTFNIKFLYN